MAIRTVVTYICDRCGHESEDKAFFSEDSYGYALIEYKAFRWTKGVTGEWNARADADNVHLCQQCTTAFMQFIKKPEVKHG